MRKLKIVYYGTPDFSAALLKQLLDADLPIEVVGVVTQPDRPVGRKQIVTPSPVKLLALERGIPVVSSAEGADLGLLFAYGKILPISELQAPTYGFWNVHPSLLPCYRGPAPIAAPLLNGDVETGVTIIQMDAELDHGPMLAQQKTYIFPVERRDQLTNRLVDMAGKMLGELFGKYAENMTQVELIEQVHTNATFTSKLTKQDGYIEIRNLKLEIRNSSKKLFNRFRALYPWPGIWTRLRLADDEGGSLVEKRLKITKIHWEDGKIVLKKVQLEGKNEVDFATFVTAYPSVF